MWLITAGVVVDLGETGHRPGQSLLHGSLHIALLVIGHQGDAIAEVPARVSHLTWFFARCGPA